MPTKKNMDFESMLLSLTTNYFFYFNIFFSDIAAINNKGQGKLKNSYWRDLTKKYQRKIDIDFIKISPEVYNLIFYILLSS